MWYLYHFIKTLSDKLYAPSDFKDDETFLKYVNKLEEVEAEVGKIQEKFDNQVIDIYLDFDLIGRKIVQILWKEKELELRKLFGHLKEINSELTHNRTDDFLFSAVYDIHIKTYWIELEGETHRKDERGHVMVNEFQIVRLTKKGESELSSFIENEIAKWE